MFVQRSRPVRENLFCTFSNVVPTGTSKLRSSELIFSDVGWVQILLKSYAGHPRLFVKILLAFDPRQRPLG
jgi:hypothetical protein